MAKTKTLTPDQLEHIRKNRAQGAKALAQELGVSRKLVDEALESSEASVSAGVSRVATLAMAAVLAAVLLGVGSWAYAGAETHDELHFDDTAGLRNNEAIRALHERYEATTRADDSVVDRARALVRAIRPTTEAIFAFNKYRMVTYWSFALTYLEHPFEEVGTRAALPGWHVSNNRIHLVNGLLVFWLAWLTFTAPAFRRRPFEHPLLLAFLTALIFTLHPMQVQAVTYLVQRTESLCATFYLLAICLYAAGRQRALSDARGSAPWLTGMVFGAAGGLLLFIAALAAKTGALGLDGMLLTAKVILAAAVVATVALVKTGRDEPLHAALVGGTFLAFGLGLQTKELAATIPFVLFAWELLFVPADALAPGAPVPAAARRLPGRPWVARAVGVAFGPRARYLGPWAAIVVGVLVLAVFFGGAQLAALLLAEGVEEGGGGQGTKISALQYLVTEANVVCTYVRLFVLPTRLHLDHDYPIAAGLSGATLLAGLSAALIATSVTLALWRGGRARVPAFALLMGLLVLSLTSTVIVLPDVIYEHRFYIVVAAAALVVAVLVDRGARLAPAVARPFIVLGAALVLALGLGLGTRARNEVWRTEVSLWKDVTEKSPDKARGWTNLGLACMNRGEWHISLSNGKAYEGLPREMPNGGTLIFPTTAIGQPPLYVPPGEVRGKVKNPVGDVGLEAALAAFDRALAIDPAYTKALNNAALVWITKGKIQELEAEALGQLAMDAQRSVDLALVGRCKTLYEAALAEQDRCYDQADALYQRILAVTPGDALALSNYSGFQSTCRRDFVQARHFMGLALGAGAPESGWATQGDLNAILGHKRYWARQAQSQMPTADDWVRSYWSDARDCYQRYLTHPLARGDMFAKAQERHAFIAKIQAGEVEPPKGDVVIPIVQARSDVVGPVGPR